MQKILTLALVVLLGASAMSTDVYAKRLGGGKSIGKQQTTPPATSPAATPAPVASPAAAPLGGNKWLGPVAGLMAGGLLASMFMGGGVEGFKMFDFVLIALLALGAYMLIRKFRAAQQQPLQYAGLNPNAYTPASAGGGAAPVSPASTRPAWFEDEPFLRVAKLNFIRLQEANDRGDLNDIREFTTPEMFAEIRMQIEERGNNENKTDVVQLNATMSNVVTEAGVVLASVRFNGLLREEAGEAKPFDEIWHIQKSATDRNASWFIAGIQQVQ